MYLSSKGTPFPSTMFCRASLVQYEFAASVHYLAGQDAEHRSLNSPALSSDTLASGLTDTERSARTSPARLAARQHSVALHKRVRANAACLERRHILGKNKLNFALTVRLQSPLWSMNVNPVMPQPSQKARHRVGTHPSKQHRRLQACRRCQSRASDAQQDEARKQHCLTQARMTKNVKMRLEISGCQARFRTSLAQRCR